MPERANQNLCLCTRVVIVRTAWGVSKKYRKVRQEMWSGKIWSDGHFVRSVGDKVTADVIRKYIQYQKQENNPEQLRMFEKT